MVWLPFWGKSANAYLAFPGLLERAQTPAKYELEPITLLGAGEPPTENAEMYPSGTELVSPSTSNSEPTLRKMPLLLASGSKYAANLPTYELPGMILEIILLEKSTNPLNSIFSLVVLVVFFSATSRVSVSSGLSSLSRREYSAPK